MSLPFRRAEIEPGPSNEGPQIKHPINWHGLRLQTPSEQVLAEALTGQGIAFAPQVPVCFTAGQKHARKIPDFLIFDDGRLGIVELDGGSHDWRSRYDNERDRLLMRKTGIIPILHYANEDVLRDPIAVIQDVLYFIRKR